MRILFLTQYYPPETGAPQNRLSDLAQRLRKYGHNVTVLTALPNYPHGKIFNGYQGRAVIEEQIAGIRVIRTWIYATNSRGLLQRLLNYFSFVLSSLLFGMARAGRHDVVVVESPPLFLGLSGIFISRLQRAKLIFNVSDLWPESAVEMGIVRNRVAITVSTWLEEFIYRHSHAITGQTQGIVASIRSRFPQKRLDLITNGIDTDVFVETQRLVGVRQMVRKEFGLDQKFVVGYAGLHGLAQGLETVIETARIISGHHEIVFAFFGDGPEKTKLVQLAANLKLDNVRFYGTQSKDKMPGIIGSLDVSLVPLRRLKLFKGALPSKLFEAMGAAIPMIISVDGEARALVDSAQAGIYVEPENAQAIAEAVLRLYRDPEYRERLGRNGRNYVVEHFDRSKIARQFEELLLRVCESTTKSPRG